MPITDDPAADIELKEAMGLLAAELDRVNKKGDWETARAISMVLGVAEEPLRRAIKSRGALSERDRQKVRMGLVADIATCFTTLIGVCATYASRTPTEKLHMSLCAIRTASVLINEQMAEGLMNLEADNEDESQTGHKKLAN